MAVLLALIFCITAVMYLFGRQPLWLCVLTAVFLVVVTGGKFLARQALR